MPVEIGAAVATAVLGETIATTTIIGTVTVGTVVGYGIASALTLGASFALAGLQDKAKSAPEQLTVRQPIPMRWRGHGTAKLGGALFYLQTPSGVLISGRVCCVVGPVSQFREFWLNDVKTSLPPGLGGVIPDPVYKRTALIDVRFGHEDQTASGLLLRGAGWDATCQLKGLAYTVGLFGPTKFGRLIYPSGEPNVRVVADLVPVYDPRDGAQAPGVPATWRWSDNAALVLLDYLTHESGYAIRSTRSTSPASSPWRMSATRGCRCGCRRPTDRPPSGAIAPGAATITASSAPTCSPATSPPATPSSTRTPTGASQSAAGAGRSRPSPSPGHDPGLGLGRGRGRGLRHRQPDQVHLHEHPARLPAGRGRPVGRRGLAGPQRHPADRARLPPLALAQPGPPAGEDRAAQGGAALPDLGPAAQPKGLPAYGRGVVRLQLPLFGIDTTFTISRGQLTGQDLTLPVFDLSSLTASAYAWNPNLEEGNAPPSPNASPATNIRSR